MVPIMEELTTQFPQCRFFSLPSSDFNGQIELGFRSALEEPIALTAMQTLLDEDQIPWDTTG